MNEEKFSFIGLSFLLKKLMTSLRRFFKGYQICRNNCGEINLTQVV